KSEDEISRHVIRRIVGVLIGNLCREDRDGTSFPVSEIGVGIDREDAWTTGYNRVRDVACAAGGANDLEPVAGDVDRLAEGHADIGVRSLVVAPLVGVVAVTVGA